MGTIDGAILDFKRLDRLASGETPLHRVDPRAKLLATLVFVFCVVSFGRYEISALVPFSIFPAVVMAAGGLPAGYLARKVALFSPFALAIGIFNPLFDRTVLMELGPVAISGGWISCASIVIRSALTVSAALALVGVTGFPALCRAAERLGMPSSFAVQLLFLYRYLLLLAEEAARASRARELRSFSRKGEGLASYAPLVGNLLLRTWLRGERIHMSMLSRGFSGSVGCGDRARFGWSDFVFLFGWSSLFVLLRLNNVSQLLGSLLTGN